MNENEEDVREVVELSVVSGDSLGTLTKSEISQQVETAKKYPRSLTKFRKECFDLVTLNQEIAAECIYALPRGGKTIEGPSVRLAEIIASCWGNCRAGSRIIGEEKDFVVAQGIFQDMERNVYIAYEVKRRITDKKGKRYNSDMIGVTANAACSIALRNAITKGIPKAFWNDIYMTARKTVAGDVKTLANRRAELLQLFQVYGVSAEMICQKLGVEGPADIGLQHIVVLRGMYTAIKDGEISPEGMFAPEPTAEEEANAEAQAKSRGKAAELNEKIAAEQKKLEERRKAVPTDTDIDELRRQVAEKAETTEYKVTTYCDRRLQGLEQTNERIAETLTEALALSVPKLKKAIEGSGG